MSPYTLWHYTHLHKYYQAQAHTHLRSLMMRSEFNAALRHVSRSDVQYFIFSFCRAEYIAFIRYFAQFKLAFTLLLCDNWYYCCYYYYCLEYKRPHYFMAAFNFVLAFFRRPLLLPSAKISIRFAFVWRRKKVHYTLAANNFKNGKAN